MLDHIILEWRIFEPYKRPNKLIKAHEQSLQANETINFVSEDT
jgi:hypothetical protein